MCLKNGCSNSKCRKSEPKLCEDIMCIGTPGEISKLINAGYISVLKLLPAMVVAIDGETGRPIDGKRLWMLQLAIDGNGCVMHKDGKCLLQDLGLTPEMGKRHLSGDADGHKERYEQVISAWDDVQNGETIVYCLESLLKHNDENHNHLN